MKGKIVKMTVLAIIVCFSTSVNATSVNWNSVEVNDIEYYMQTDKAIYNLGENVEMLYKVTNLSNANVMFGFGGDPEWNFWVEKVLKAGGGLVVDLRWLLMSPRNTHIHGT
jgi:hypothetical protein